jgi:hypothetical protein
MHDGERPQRRAKPRGTVDQRVHLGGGRELERRERVLAHEHERDRHRGEEAHHRQSAEDRAYGGVRLDRRFRCLQCPQASSVLVVTGFGTVSMFRVGLLNTPGDTGDSHCAITVNRLVKISRPMATSSPPDAHFDSHGNAF